MDSILVEARRVKYISLLERKLFIYLSFYKCPLSESHTALSRRAFYLKTMRAFILRRNILSCTDPSEQFALKTREVGAGDTKGRQDGRTIGGESGSAFFFVVV